MAHVGPLPNMDNHHPIDVYSSGAWFLVLTVPLIYFLVELLPSTAARDEAQPGYASENESE